MTDATTTETSTVSNVEETVSGEAELIEASYQSFSRPDPNDPFTYTLTLTPQEEPFYVAVHLTFHTAPPYPVEPLHVEVKSHTGVGLLATEHTMGLAEHQVRELQEAVDARCTESKGRPAGWAVLGLINEFLSRHNVKNVSLHDDMATQPKPDQPDLMVSVKENRTFERRCPPCLAPGDKRIFYRDPTSKPNTTTMNMTVLGEFRDRKGLFSAVDEGFKLRVIHEYVLDLSTVLLDGTLCELQKDFSRTRLNHKYILEYLSVLCSIENPSNVVHTLTPEVWALSEMLSASRPYANTRELARQMISALKYLHNQDTFHGCLTVASVYLNRRGHHLLGDHGFARTTLLKSTQKPMVKGQTLEFCIDTAKEAGASLDVLLLGNLVLQVTVGTAPTSLYPVAPCELEEPLLEFIKSSTRQDRKSRATLDTLEQSDYIGETEPIEIRFEETPVADQNEEEAYLTISATSRGEEGAEGVPAVSGFWNSSALFNRTFQYMEVLGQGGFGSVIKVKHKIDKHVYALKLIKLTRPSKKEKDEMKSEVELLSRIQHENIVRYHNVSYDLIPRGSEDQSSSSGSSSSSEGEEGEESEEGEEEDESEESEDKFTVSTRHIRSRYVSDGSDDLDIVFEASMKVSPAGTNGSAAGGEASTIVDGAEPSEDSEVQEQLKADIPSDKIFVMFIQMEYCENTTLRKLIDDRSRDPPLSQDWEMITRILRQIIDALEYLHESGKIHRDLKPDNVFLDAKYNVKVGDFGLAISGCAGSSFTYSGSAAGTGLYMAPEVKLGRYSFPIDIYSLGVITFEMVRGPFTTQSERLEVLGGIRSAEVKIPRGVFAGEKRERLERVVRRMLSHQYEERPSAMDLANNDILPPRLAQEGINHILRHINSDIDSPKRVQLFDCLFSDVISNKVMSGYRLTSPSDSQGCTAFTKRMNGIIDPMTEVFIKHGAMQCPLPFLLPKCDLTDGQRRPFSVITRTGHYHVLPNNLKLNLAKHVLDNRLTRLKRYGFTQVFRQRRPDGMSTSPTPPEPREILEGSFDVISSGHPHIAKAEVLTALLDVLDTLPRRSGVKYTVYINHTKILEAILLYFNLPEVYHPELLRSIYKLSGDYGRLHEAILRETRDTNMKEKNVSELLKILKHEGPVHLISKSRSDIFHTILYKHPAQRLFKEGLQEILQVLLLAQKPSKLEDQARVLDSSARIEDLVEKLEQDWSEVVRFRPGVLNDPHAFRGLNVQVVVHSEESSDLVASAGDFRLLLEKWQTTEPEKTSDFTLPTAAFGATFLLEDMCERRTLEPRTKVLVRCRPDEHSEGLFYLTRRLAEHGISLEVAGEEEESPKNFTHRITFTDDASGVYVETSAAYVKALKDKEEQEGVVEKFSRKPNNWQVYALEQAVEYLVDVEGRWGKSGRRREEQRREASPLPPITGRGGDYPDQGKKAGKKQRRQKNSKSDK